MNLVIIYNFYLLFIKYETCLALHLNKIMGAEITVRLHTLQC